MKKMILTLLVALPLSVFAQKFGHFDSADIIQSMPEYTTAQTELEAQSKIYEQELDRMQKELSQKINAYEKEGATMSDAQKQSREQELQELSQKQRDYYSQSQAAISQLSNKKMEDIRQKVLKAVEEVGKAGGYVYIMDTTAGIPYISTTLSTDVSAQIKAKLGIK